MVGLQLNKQSVTFIEMHLALQRRVKILVQTNKLANPQNLLIRFLFFRAYRVTFGDPSTPHLQCFGAFDHHDVFEYLVTTKSYVFEYLVTTKSCVFEYLVSTKKYHFIEDLFSSAIVLFSFVHFVVHIKAGLTFSIVFILFLQKLNKCHSQTNN